MAFPNLQVLKHNEQLEELRQNMSVLRRRSWEALRKRNEDARAAYETRLAPGEERPFAFGLCYSKLFWIFMVGNVVGFVLETLYALVRTHEFQIRVGLVFGPFIPVYGLGAVAITLLLWRMYNQKDIMIFWPACLSAAPLNTCAALCSRPCLARSPGSTATPP